MCRCHTYSCHGEPILVGGEISLELPYSSPERQEHCPKGVRLQAKATGVQNFFILLLLLSTLMVVFVIAEGYTATRPVQDMVQYWAAARLVTQNPYSLRLVWPLEKSVGARIGVNDPTFVNRNPPWALLFFLPLRWLSFRAAYASWTVFSLLVVVGCARVLWRLYTPKPSLVPAFLSLSFGPTICLLSVGQSTILVLLGITVFLWAVQQKRDWIAGSSLLLVSVKPHIALIFLLAVGLWAAYEKCWAVFIGGVSAVVTSTLVILIISPNILAQYLYFMSKFAQVGSPYPNLGGLISTATRVHALAFLPEVLGIVWLGVYWWQRRTTWSWTTNGLVVLLVTVACSYYSFAYDEVILLPAVLAAAAHGNRRILFIFFGLINAGYIFFLSGTAAKLGITYMFLWWTASAWLLTYLLSQWQASVPVEVRL